MQEKENVILILEATIQAMKKQDVVKLKELSNQTIHTASITQDPDNILVAVIVYSLGKTIERKDYQTYPGWEKFYDNLITSINNSIKSLKNNDDKGLKLHLEEIRKCIDKLSGKLKTYIQDVFTKAKINKASKIYEHGISREKTASLLGVTMFDLASYSGQKQLPENPLSRTSDVKSRIKLAMGMFG